jgi:hypothetical protein
MDLEWRLGLAGRTLDPAALSARDLDSRRLGERPARLPPSARTLEVNYRGNNKQAGRPTPAGLNQEKNIKQQTSSRNDPHRKHFFYFTAPNVATCITYD